MMLAQAEELGDGSEDELFQAQADDESDGTLKYRKDQPVPLDETSCDAAKSATRRWWDVWYDWEDGACWCWGWDGHEETWMTVTNEVNSNRKTGARC